MVPFQEEKDGDEEEEDGVEEEENYDYVLLQHIAEEEYVYGDEDASEWSADP